MQKWAAEIILGSVKNSCRYLVIYMKIYIYIYLKRHRKFKTFKPFFSIFSSYDIFSLKERFLHTHMYICILIYELKHYEVTPFTRYKNKNWHARANCSNSSTKATQTQGNFIHTYAHTHLYTQKTKNFPPTKKVESVCGLYKIKKQWKIKNRYISKWKNKKIGYNSILQCLNKHS